MEAVQITRKINPDEMERRVIYLRGYYNSLATAEETDIFENVYKEILNNLIWAMGDEPQEINGET